MHFPLKSVKKNLPILWSIEPFFSLCVVLISFAGSICNCCKFGNNNNNGNKSYFSQQKTQGRANKITMHLPYGFNKKGFIMALLNPKNYSFRLLKTSQTKSDRKISFCAQFGRRNHLHFFCEGPNHRLWTPSHWKCDHGTPNWVPFSPKSPYFELGQKCN